MLVLGVKHTEAVAIGPDIVVRLVATSTGRMRLQIAAPKSVTILHMGPVDDAIVAEVDHGANALELADSVRSGRGGYPAAAGSAAG